MPQISCVISVGRVQSVKPNTERLCVRFPLVLQSNLQIVFNFANLVSTAVIQKFPD